MQHLDRWSLDQKKTCPDVLAKPANFNKVNGVKLGQKIVFDQNK